MSAGRTSSAGLVCWLGLGLGFVLAAVPAPPAVAGPPQPAQPLELLYPRQPFALTFRHGAHLQECPAPGCDERCRACHPTAAASRRAGDRLLPTVESCAVCHRADGRGAAAAAPLPGAWGLAGSPPAGPPWPTPARLVFAHAPHAALPCPTCHAIGDLDRRRAQPTMALCLRCHPAQGPTGGCPTCHLALPDGTLQTRFDGAYVSGFGPLAQTRPGTALLRATHEPSLLRPTGTLFGARHDGRWRQDHGRVAPAAGRFCQACHVETWCSQCHADRFLPPAIHPAGWLAEHGGAAGGGQTRRCQSCHRLASFCVGCHRRQGVVAGGEGGARPFPLLGGFHPPGWANLVAPGPESHGRAARRGIGSCVACHQEATCVRCHRSRDSAGLGIPIHPTVFGERCRQLWQASERLCRRCHPASFGQGSRCR